MKCVEELKIKLMQISKTGKKQKNLYLSSKARQLLASLSLKMGISETAVVELLVREKAGQQITATAARRVKQR